MWWGHHSDHRRGGSALWLAVFVVIGFAVISGRSGSWGWWVLFPVFFFFVFPVACRQVFTTAASGKHNNGAYNAEKPKREPRPPHYILSEDGEPLEVIEEDVSRRKQKPDESEYV